MVLQYFYKSLLNFFYERVTSKIPEKYIGKAIIFCFLAIFAVQYISQYVYDFEGFTRDKRDYLICLFFGLIILLSVNKKLEIVKWKLSIYLPYTIAALLIFIAGFDHILGPAYRVFPLTMLVAFLCLFYVWQNRKDYIVLFTYAATAYLIYITVLLVMCILKCPLDVYYYLPMDYSPFDINPNGVTKLFVPGIASALFLSLATDKKHNKILFNVLAGCFAGVVLLTNCRAGLLITPIMIIIYAIGLAQGGLSIKEKLLSVGKGLLVIVIALLLCQYIIKDITIIIYENSCTYVVAQTEEQTDNNDNAAANEADEQKPKWVLREERLDSLGDRISGKPFLSKLDSILAQRISIWTVYFDHMSWQGEEELLFYSTEFAHNQYVELSYKAGIPVGILYLMWVIFSGIVLIKRCFRGGMKKPGIYFQLLLYPMFFIISMLDTGIIPFERGFIFMFYLSTAPLFFDEESLT